MHSELTFAVAQLGARMHYAVPLILHKAGALDRLYTDIYADAGLGRAITSIPGLHSFTAFRKLQDRRAPGLPVSLVTSFGSLGLRYWSQLRKVRSENARIRSFLWMSREFGKAVCRHGFGSANAVYGFNSSSLEIFKHAKQRGIRTVLEQTIAPKRVEAAILSRFGSDSGSAEGPEFEEFCRVEEEEWALADLILCASEFVRDGLRQCGVDPGKCVVVPYGVDTTRFGSASLRTARGMPVRILFVGGIGERKGAHTLLNAMRQVGHRGVECQLVGPMVGDDEKISRACPPNTRIIRTLPRADIPGVMREADIFCLPSLCEGSATVIYEALASGLPVVTTHNAGSLVRDGVEGFIVPAGDTDALAAALLRLTEDANLRKRMSERAIERSAQGSLSAYHSRLLRALSIHSEPDVTV